MRNLKEYKKAEQKETDFLESCFNNIEGEKNG